MYSLVSATVLGFDLARRRGGAQVAAVLRDALALTPADLPVVAAVRQRDQHRDQHGHQPDDQRADPSAQQAHDDAWLAVARSEGQRREVVSLLGDVHEAAGTGIASAVALTLHELEIAPLGSLASLLHCVRTDVLDWTWRSAGEVSLQAPTAERATSIVCDAVAASYCHGLTPAERQHLAAPWARAQRLLDAVREPVEPVLPAPVEALLERLSRLDVADVEALRARSADLGRTGDWAESVHEASWAVHLTGRVRTAASVQLRGVEALARSGVSASDAATGLWNTVSGALAAHLVADVLADDVLAELLVPVRAALAPGCAGPA